MRNILALAVIVCLFTHGYAKDEKVLDRIESYHIVYLDGQKIGALYSLLDEYECDGQKRYRGSATLRMNMEVEGKTLPSVRTDAWSADENFRLLEQSGQAVAGDQKDILRVTIDGGKCTVSRTLAGETKTDTFPVPQGGIGVSVNEYMIERLGLLKKGAALTQKIVEPTSGRLMESRIEYAGEETIELGGKRMKCHKLTVREEWMKEQPTFFYIYEERIVRVVTGSIRADIATKEEHDRDFAPARISSFIPVVNAPKGDGNPARLRIAIVSTKDGDNFQDLFPDCAYYKQTATAQDRLTLELKSVRPGADTGSATLAADIPEDVRKFLTASSLAQSGAAALAERAQGIVGDEKNALAAATKICAWVFANVRQQEVAAGRASALETLGSGAGNCNELAYLFAALSRAAGIPARVALGILIDGETAGYHAWAEVWAGEWIPVDPTRKRIGVPAGYLRLATGDDNEGELEIARAVSRIFGNIRIDVLK